MKDQGFAIRHRLLVLLSAAIAALVLSAGPHGQSVVAASDRMWFAPSPGSIDYLDLFTRPDEWPLARQLVSVFKFYQQHTQTPAPALVGPNTYDALVRANAFRLLTSWHKAIAIEAGAVKDFYCTPDASGMNAAIAVTVASIQAVQAAGGTVGYVSMDDPFASGQATVCGGPALEPTADRIATYVHAVGAAFPGMRIGFSEAFPLLSEPSLERALDLLIARAAAPAFLHVDVDSRALVRFGADFTRDMRALSQACRARGVAFGVILWGYNGDADALYAADAGAVAREVGAAFPTWEDMPDNLIVQSWAVSSTGLAITPSNLPEDQLDTHTNLVRQFWHQFRGQTAPPVDTAVKKRP
ncbi:MAG TPA: hypothetical protein VGI12_07500 [Vicinamibacterales bacterium]